MAGCARGGVSSDGSHCWWWPSSLKWHLQPWLTTLCASSSLCQKKSCKALCVCCRRPYAAMQDIGVVLCMLGGR